MTTQPSLTPAAFAAKWHGVTTTEKASAQEHFIDLCRMLGEPTPGASARRGRRCDALVETGENVVSIEMETLPTSEAPLTVG